MLAERGWFECRHGGWDGKKWLSDVYILDTSKFFAQRLSKFPYAYICTQNVWLWSISCLV